MAMAGVMAGVAVAESKAGHLGSVAGLKVVPEVTGGRKSKPIRLDRWLKSAQMGVLLLVSGT